MQLKRWYSLIGVTTLIAAVCGMTLSITLEHGMDFRSTFSQIMIILSLVGLAIMATIRPGVQRAHAMEHRGTVSEKTKNECTFKNVAANETALRSLKEIADFLKDPEKYSRYGARMPKGVLLYGPPGTGKTLLARALAGEANVPFYAMSGDEFVEKYVGVGAGRVRELFKKARKSGKCVIFIDEIDAMGKKRDENSSDERDQTLNALLSEMSGFYTEKGIVVIAATNRIEMLDPALLRPGRFDRQIEVGLPGKKERLCILRLHSENKPIGSDVNLEEIAAQTTYFSGASLESLLNEAAIQAASRGALAVEMKDITQAFQKMIAGDDRESTANREEKCVIALHEAGHTLLSRLLMPDGKLVRVSILPTSGGAAGYNLCIPRERVMMRKQEIEDQVCMLLAGRAAEILIGGEDALTSGASGDLAKATEIVAGMVNELGMLGEPAVSMKVLNRIYGGGTNAVEICRKHLSVLYERTQKLLADNVEALMAITEALIDRESLEEKDVDEILKKFTLSNERQKSA